MSTSNGHHRAATILVTDVGRGAGLVFVRSLGRAGYRVVAVDSDAHSPGFASRWAAVRRLVPTPEQDWRVCVAAILQAVGDERVALVVPVTDAAIVPLAAQRERVEAATRLAMPPAAALAAAADKARTLDCARRLGIRVPETTLVHTAAEARAAAAALGWPVVLQPRVSRTLEGDAGASHE